MIVGVVVAGPRPEYLSLGAVDVTAGVLLNFSTVFFFFFFFCAWKKNHTPVAGIRTRIPERS